MFKHLYSYSDARYLPHRQRSLLTGGLALIFALGCSGQVKVATDL